MTRRYPWTLGGAVLLTILLICLLTVTSLAQATTQGEGETACSEGCHERRDEPRPDWHPDIGERAVMAGSAESQGIAPTQPLTATILVISASPRVTSAEPVTLTATLRDILGAPVPGAQIRFSLEAEFAGTRGQMEIGAARTDAEGRAFLDYEPSVAQRTHLITARFTGTGTFAPSEQRIDVVSVGAPVPAYVVAPVGLEAVGRWALGTFLIAVLGVWAAFGYVVYQAYAIWRGA